MKPRVLVLIAILNYSGLAFAEIQNGMDAAVVLGQPDFTEGTANNGGLGPSTFNQSYPAFTNGRQLFVTDALNSRILIWNTIPTGNFTPADVVLGQPDLASGTANNGGIGARTLNEPRGVFSDGRRLFVADGTNSRILIWNTIPTANFTPADVVVGQPDFASSAFNNGGLGASTLRIPIGIFSDGRRLFIGDQGNHRVLIWNSIPTANFTPADVVLGQPDFTQDTANNGGRGASTISVPNGVFSDGRRLFVVDQGNRRILIWNTIPTVNFAPANVVVGQPDFTSNTANNGGIGARTMNAPVSVFSDGRRLFVDDRQNHRVLVWNTVPTTNFAPADVVLGQPDFTQATANNGGRGANTLNTPRGVFSDGRRLFVSDQGNHRVLIFNLANADASDLGPQFTQGKALVGKVFWDWNGNGVQDAEEGVRGRGVRGKHPTDTPYPLSLTPERGIEGIKVVSDTGIYAITDSDGKYHFPYIETGQRILKIDEMTLPEGATLTTESPRKILVTEGVLSKVSFGIQLAAGSLQLAAKDENDGKPLLKATITQDPLLVRRELSIRSQTKDGMVEFLIHTNYPSIIRSARLALFDSNARPLREIPLPEPLPYRFELPISEFGEGGSFYCQLRVRDDAGNEDATRLSGILTDMVN